MATRAVALRRAPVPRAFTRAFRRRKKPGFKLSIAMAAGFVPYGQSVWDGYKAEGFTGAAKRATKITGYDPYTQKWSLRYMQDAGVPAIIAGYLVHRLAKPINRMIARFKLPVEI